MIAGGALDADVRTLPAKAVAILQWWIGQLQELTPRRWKHRPDRRPLIVWDPQTGSIGSGNGQRPIPRGRSSALVLPDRLAFVRTLELPRMTTTDLRRLVELEIERLSPLPSSETIIGIDDARAGDGLTAKVDVAVVPRALAQQALQAASEAGAKVARLGLIGSSGKPHRFNFMPALDQAGLLGTNRSPAMICWAIVAFAFLLNIIALIARDEQSVSRLTDLANQQAPALSTAHMLEARAANLDAARREFAARRRGDVTSALAIASEDLPAAAWVQRFSYHRGTVRIIGYKDKDTDVVAAFRKDPRIVSVHLDTSQMATQTPLGQPFDVTMSLGTVQ